MSEIKGNIFLNPKVFMQCCERDEIEVETYKEYFCDDIMNVKFSVSRQFQDYFSTQKNIGYDEFLNPGNQQTDSRYSLKVAYEKKILGFFFEDRSHFISMVKKIRMLLIQNPSHPSASMIKANMSNHNKCFIPDAYRNDDDFQWLLPHKTIEQLQVIDHYGLHAEYGIMVLVLTSLFSKHYDVSRDIGLKQKVSMSDLVSGFLESQIAGEGGITKYQMWEAGLQWYRRSQMEGSRFHGLQICNDIFSHANQKNEDIPIYVTNQVKDKETETLPVMQCFENFIHGDFRKNLYLIGQGGIGKTTALYHIMQEVYSAGERSKGRKYIPLFIELSKAPDSDTGKIYSVGCGSTFIRREIYRLLNDSLTSSGKIPDCYTLDDTITVDPIDHLLQEYDGFPEYILLLDGLNEVSRNKVNNISVMSRILNEIHDLASDLFPNVRIILTSRFEEEVDSKSNIEKWYLSGITEKEIFQFLAQKGFSEIDIQTIGKEKHLLETLRIPLFLTIYGSLGHHINVTTQGEIFKAYYHSYSLNGDFYSLQNRIASVSKGLLENQEGFVSRMSLDVQRFVINILLPELAFYMEQNELFYIAKDRAIKILLNLLSSDEEETFLSISGLACFDLLEVAEEIDHLKKVSVIWNEIIEFSIHFIGILQIFDGKIGFVHHHIRDYFSATKVINNYRYAAYLWENHDYDIAKNVLEPIEKRVFDIEVRRFIGESLGEHLNKPFNNDDLWKYTVPSQKSVSCDRNLLVRVLDVYRNNYSRDIGYGIYNIISILIDVRKDLSGENLTNLDLSLCNFNGVHLGHSGLGATISGSKVNPDVFSVKGHKGYVYYCGANPKDNTYVTGGTDNHIKIWDMDSGTCLRTLKGHHAFIEYVDYAEDGTTILSVSRDCQVRIWNTQTRECSVWNPYHSLVNVYTNISDNQCNMAVVLEAYSENLGRVDGPPLVIEEKNVSIIDVWNIRTRTFVSSIRYIEKQNRPLIYMNQRGNLLLTNERTTGKIDLWNTNDGKWISGLFLGDKDNFGNRIAIQINDAFLMDKNDQTYVILGCEDGFIHVYRLENEKWILIKSFQGDTSAVERINYSYDSKLLMSSTKEHIKVWDTDSWKCISSLSVNNTVMEKMLIHPYNCNKLISCDGRTTYEWDLSRQQLTRTISNIDGYIPEVLFAEDENHLYCILDPDYIECWDIEKRKCVNRWSFQGEVTRHLIKSEKYHKLAVFSGPYIYMWNMEKPYNFKCLKVDRHARLKSFIDENTILFELGPNLMLADMKKKEIRIVVQGHSKRYDDFEFSSENNIILIGSDDSISFRNLDNTEKYIPINGDFSDRRQFQYANDGTKLFLATENAVKIWNETSKEFQYLFDMKRAIYMFASGGGDFVIAVSHSEVSVWNKKDKFFVYQWKPDENCVIVAADYLENEDKLLLSLDGPQGQILMIRKGIENQIITTMQTSYGLHLKDVNMENLHPESELSEDLIKIMTCYGAVF